MSDDVLRTAQQLLHELDASEAVLRAAAVDTLPYSQVLAVERRADQLCTELLAKLGRRAGLPRLPTDTPMLAARTPPTTIGRAAPSLGPGEPPAAARAPSGWAAALQTPVGADRASSARPSVADDDLETHIVQPAPAPDPYAHLVQFEESAAEPDRGRATPATVGRATPETWTTRRSLPGDRPYGLPVGMTPPGAPSPAEFDDDEVTAISEDPRSVSSMLDGAAAKPAERGPAPARSAERPVGIRAASAPPQRPLPPAPRPTARPVGAPPAAPRVGGEMTRPTVKGEGGVTARAAGAQIAPGAAARAAAPTPATGLARPSGGGAVGARRMDGRHSAADEGGEPRPVAAPQVSRERGREVVPSFPPVAARGSPASRATPGGPERVPASAEPVARAPRAAARATPAVGPAPSGRTPLHGTTDPGSTGGRVTSGLYGGASVPSIRQTEEPRPRAAAIQLTAGGGARVIGLEEEDEPIEVDAAEHEEEVEYSGGFSLSVQEYSEDDGEPEEEAPLEEDLGRAKPDPRAHEVRPPAAPGPTSEEVQQLLERAQYAAAAGDLAVAADLFGDAIDAEPGNAGAHIARGRLYLDLGDYTRAMSDFLMAEDLAPHDPEPQVAIGDLYFARKDYRKAIEHFDQALAVDPNHAMAFCRRGISHHYRKNYREAVEDLARAQRLDPEIPNVDTFLSMARKKLGKR